MSRRPLTLRTFYNTLFKRVMESGNVSTSEPQATTNGSFQNHTPAATTALLDISNLSDEPRSRKAGQQARRALQAQASLFAPRGDPVQGAMR